MAKHKYHSSHSTSHRVPSTGSGQVRKRTVEKFSGIPKGYEAGEKSYKLTVEQYFYKPMKPFKPSKAKKFKEKPMEVKVVNVVKTK